MKFTSLSINYGNRGGATQVSPNFLEQYYPEDALDIDYIRGKTDDVAATREK
jgi:hypothetical protein